MWHTDGMKIMLYAVIAWAGLSGWCLGQGALRSSFDDRNIIVPQRRVIAPVHRGNLLPVVIDKVDAEVLVTGRHAQTRLTLDVRNDGHSATEAELILPVPEGVVIKGFYYGDKKTTWQASLMPADEARKLYDSIVARRLDPALLEFAGFCAIRSSVFPVPAKSSVKLGIVYEQLLAPVSGRLDYILPRTEALSGHALWNIRVELAPQQEGKGAFGNVFTPSHPMSTNVLKNGTAVLTLAEEKMSPGPFRLSWQEGSLTKDAAERPEISVYATPDATDRKNGYLLAMLGGTMNDEESRTIPREVTLVLDRSGSMRGEKLRSMKEAAKQIISGLNPGEKFNVIIYNEGVDVFEKSTVEKNAATEKSAHDWLDSVVARGGTNIHEALKQALLQPASEGMLPVVLFLTDGLPTIGTRTEKSIISLVRQENPQKRRIFTIGVGEDLNATLLRRMAEDSGGLPTYILSGENLEVKLAQVFKQLHGPLFRDLTYTVCDMDGREKPGRLQDQLPAGTLTDVFAGTPAVITGRYVGTEPFQLKIQGLRRDAQAFEHVVTVIPEQMASVKDDFVARLWAARKIGCLESALMDMGEDLSNVKGVRDNPRTKELIEEMTRLSREFGIMSSVASFFADDSNGHAWNQSNPLARTEDVGRLMTEREGSAAIALQQNTVTKKNVLTLNKFNRQVNADGNTVVGGNTAQIAQNAYFDKNGIWMENTVLNMSLAAPAIRTVQVGTPEYAAVADQLIQSNRQGLLALDGSVMIRLNGETVLMQNSLSASK